ncbi:MAG: S-methyl-5-thioribose-1-phosphate isomerase [Nanoarchaeota archaeon]|nr:S-methyl-5-thioribose-1-phosphate isomerase [Nanoarchaeota archaeon]MBU4124554.1 S-methyl-5-thioribose-1-phosphate isomerase [Nanoarchaeota archaeon]
MLSRLIKDIKTMDYQGANQIAIASLEYLKKTKLKDFEKVSKQLEAARPTAVVLHNCLEVIRKDKSINTINKLINQIKRARNQIGEKGSKLIKNNSKIMTHCHSGDALSIIKEVAKTKRIEVYATETEPKHQGIITAKELHALGIKVTVIEDPAAAYFMKDMDYVIVGCDAIRKEGVANKIGTYNLAILAKKFKKSFYMAGNTLKLDNRKKFEIEERPVKEVYAGKLKGIKVRNPAFDVTTYDLITRVITEKGVMTPANVKRLLR